MCTKVDRGESGSCWFEEMKFKTRKGSKGRANILKFLQYYTLTTLKEPWNNDMMTSQQLLRFTSTRTRTSLCVLLWSVLRTIYTFVFWEISLHDVFQSALSFVSSAAVIRVVTPRFTPTILRFPNFIIYFYFQFYFFSERLFSKYNGWMDGWMEPFI